MPTTSQVYVLELHQSVRRRRVSHASLRVYKSEDRRLCILTVFVLYQYVHHNGNTLIILFEQTPGSMVGWRSPSRTEPACSHRCAQMDVCSD